MTKDVVVTTWSIIIIVIIFVFKKSHQVFSLDFFNSRPVKNRNILLAIIVILLLRIQSSSSECNNNYCKSAIKLQMSKYLKQFPDGHKNIIIIINNIEIVSL